MEFWKKLNRASAVTIAVSAVGAGVAVILEKAGGATFSGLAAAAWLTFGLISAAGLGALTLIGDRVLTARQIERYRGALILANLVWVSGLVATTSEWSSCCTMPPARVTASASPVSSIETSTSRVFLGSTRRKSTWITSRRTGWRWISLTSVA